MIPDPPQPDPLSSLAQLLRERNAIDARIAHLIRRPAERGHIGEFIAAAIFDIALQPGARCPDHRLTPPVPPSVAAATDGGGVAAPAARC